MDTYNKLEWLTFAIQESINGNHGELENALMVVEDLREPYLKKKEELLDCSVCKQSKDHEKMYNVACFDKEQIEDCELQNIIRNNPQIMKDDNLICFDCLDNKDNHKQ